MLRALSYRYRGVNEEKNLSKHYIAQVDLSFLFTHFTPWFPECPLFRGKNIAFGTEGAVVSAVGSLEVVASRRLLMYWDFQSGPEALSTLGSVSDCPFREVLHTGSATAMGRGTGSHVDNLALGLRATAM